MPRVTFEEFYARYKELREAWQSPVYPFSNLAPHEQWYLHSYYLPSQKLTKKELRTHWQELHATSTPLHQQAGRAYARLKSVLDGETYELQPKTQVGSGRGFNVVVFGTVNPKPDVKLALDAVRMLAEEMRMELKKGLRKILDGRNYQIHVIQSRR